MSSSSEAMETETPLKKDIEETVEEIRKQLESLEASVFGSTPYLLLKRDGLFLVQLLL